MVQVCRTQALGSACPEPSHCGGVLCRTALSTWSSGTYASTGTSWLRTLSSRSGVRASTPAVANHRLCDGASRRESNPEPGIRDSRLIASEHPRACQGSRPYDAIVSERPDASPCLLAKLSTRLSYAHRAKPGARRCREAGGGGRCDQRLHPGTALSWRFRHHCVRSCGSSFRSFGPCLDGFNATHK